MISGRSLQKSLLTGSDAGGVRHDVVRLRRDGPAREAIRLGVKEGQSPWDMGTIVMAEGAVDEGDVLFATFEMRSVKSMTGQSLVNFICQGGAPGYAKSAMVRLSVGTEWARFHLPFVAENLYGKGESMAGFHLSLTDQTLEIADFQVLGYGPDFDIDSLPKTDLSCDGQADDAPRRAEAAERIDRLRKADVEVEVVDAAGRPVEGARVEIEMIRHGFPFGTAVAVSKMLLDSEDGDRYREELNKNFNSGVFESAMKWKNHGTGTPEQIDASLDLLEEARITMRGHVLMWPGWDWVPDDIQERYKGDKAAFRKVMEDRVYDYTLRYKDRIQDWDVVNEAFGVNDILKIYGEEVMIDWFNLAHRGNPDAVLYINDNDTLTAADRDTRHMAAYEDQIEMLLDAGAPLGGIGTQGHFSTSLQSPVDIWKLLDRFGRHGLPIRVTEFDVLHDDPQVQADYQRDFLSAVFAHGSIAGFTMWGFWEGQHGRPQAALFDRDWNLRPHGEACRDLVYGEWWTDVSGETGRDGAFATRGFLGEHTVKVTGPTGGRSRRSWT